MMMMTMIWTYSVAASRGPLSSAVSLLIWLQDGIEYGDEYLAELDLIEVIESTKEGYESDVKEEDLVESETSSEVAQETKRDRNSDRYFAFPTPLICFVLNLTC